MLISSNIFQNVDDAGSYLSSQWGDFVSQQSTLQSYFAQALANAEAAQAINDNADYIQARADMTQIQNSLQDWQDIYTQLYPYASAAYAIGLMGQWQAIIASSAAFLLAVGYLYSWYQQISLDYQNWSLNNQKFQATQTAIASGQLTPAQAAAGGAYTQTQPVSSGSSFSDILKSGTGLILVAIFGYVVLKKSHA